MKINKSSIRGFTLIELLIVLVIIGVTSGVAILNFRMFDPDQQLPQEARRLMQTLIFVADYAEIQQEPVLIEWHDKGYRFWVAQDISESPVKQSGWVPADEKSLLKPYEWPLNYQISLEYQDNKLLDNLSQNLKNSLIFWPSGRLDAVKIQIKTENRVFEILGQSFGQFTIKEI
jgi:type II secretion system protein H